MSKKAAGQSLTQTWFITGSSRGLGRSLAVAALEAGAYDDTIAPTHLPLGVNATEMAQDYSRRQLNEAEAWQAVSRSADFGQPYPVELPVRVLS